MLRRRAASRCVRTAFSSKPSVPFTQSPRPVTVCRANRAEGSLATTALQAVETCCLIGCICTTVALLYHPRQQQQQQQQQQQGQTKHSAALQPPATKSRLLQSSTSRPGPAALHTTASADLSWTPPAWYSWNGCITLQSTLLLVALICARLGAFTLRLGSHGAAGPRLSADAGALLARLESSVSEQQQQMQVARQQMDKAALRYKLQGAEVKKPIQQVQGALSQQAHVLTQLSAAQELLRLQVQEDEQVLEALQGVTAKQFLVTMQAVQRVQEQQEALAQVVRTAASRQSLAAVNGSEHEPGHRGSTAAAQRQQQASEGVKVKESEDYPDPWAENQVARTN